MVPGRSVPGWLRWAGPAVLASALTLYLVVYLRWPAYFGQVDALVYRFGGQRIVDGRDLYSTGIFGSRRILLFTYTPFAAVCFMPLTLLPPMWVQTLSLASVPALLGDAVRRGLAALHIRAASRMWPLAALLIGLCLWLEPVRYSAQWGQINVLLLAVVIADVVASPERKWAGVGVGLVAGIKLTPLIFLIYLALIGRLRAALLGSAAFAATVAVGFVVTPKDSQFYWLQRYFGWRSRGWRSAAAACAGCSCGYTTPPGLPRPRRFC